MTSKRDSEKTIARILETAQKLFFEKGYDNTTMQDIIDYGFSKGSIYHHFKSKKEIFDHIMMGLEGQENQFKYYLELDDKTSLQRLRLLFLNRLNDYSKADLLSGAREMFNDPKIFGELYQMNMTHVLPRIEQFIIEGNTDGSMQCQSPFECAELITYFFSIWIGTMLYDVNISQLKSKIEFYQSLFKGLGVDLLDAELVECIIVYYKRITKVA
ncbi:TetR/AcrR family transcriptional regulator [Erysipelothrix sp. HDW6C]|uniref:TetR/AcrR family transcriptional regulator n=1 Tax=Erysipelothrix sp. HDW6C TaxID=2714930 RepID=UPI00140A3EE2|nr:TetR/AcrR family transcriptional regulator [Erysipelothrix sp. HDW6C]QIK70688.1 TetR/AcrR family transcriptional regulator [Erysipelothrix sp. HDW6C]